LYGKEQEDVQIVTLDPNLVYVILLAGLWLSVTAVYVPGTGLVEMLALIVILAAIYVLAGMPTNWIAVIVLVIGVLGFLIMPFVNMRFAWLAVGGLVLQAVGSLTLFNGIAVSPAVIAVTIVVALLYHRFALMRIIAFHRARPAMIDDESIIGAYGHVQTALNPIGTVYVRGESWTARSTEQRTLKTGAEIVVVDREGLTLFVENVKPKREQQD
jgi:membrane-bound serine protease (ClpP class)